MTDDLEIIKREVEKLENLKNKKDDEIEDQLQKINICFLNNYIIEISNLKIYPVEVESYYYNKKFFKDQSVHKYKFQRDKNHFGNLYFHRYKNSENINFCRGGFDVCLCEYDKVFDKDEDFNKDENAYCLSILIRSAYINSKEELVCGINKLLRRIYNISYRQKISDEVKEKYKNFEDEKDEKDEKIINIIKHDNNYINFKHHPRIINNKYFCEHVKYKNDPIAKKKLNTFIFDKLDELVKKSKFYTKTRKASLEKSYYTIENREVTIQS